MDTIDLVPGAFVTKHQEVWIDGRKLEMVQPGGIREAIGALARGDVDREDRAGQFRFIDQIEKARFIGIFS